MIKILKSRLLMLMAELLSFSLCLCSMSSRPLMTEMVPFCRSHCGILGKIQNLLIFLMSKE